MLCGAQILKSPDALAYPTRKYYAGEQKVFYSEAAIAKSRQNSVLK